MGKPINTDQVADRLAAISTVSRGVIAQGRTVKLDGQSVNSAERVKASHIIGLRVRFILETTHTSGGQVATHSLIDNNILWGRVGRQGEQRRR